MKVVYNRRENEVTAGSNMMPLEELSTAKTSLIMRFGAPCRPLSCEVEQKQGKAQNSTATRSYGFEQETGARMDWNTFQ